MSTNIILDEGFTHYYNFKIDNLPDGGEMRITEEKLLEFDALLNRFEKPNKKAFIAFVKLIKKYDKDCLDFPLTEK